MVRPELLELEDDGLKGRGHFFIFDLRFWIGRWLSIETKARGLYLFFKTEDHGWWTHVKK
jgi:hypothetical protein